MYGRETPDELDFADVWESTYTNFICPEYFYHFFFCGIIYSFETEVY
jgi:NADH dehydrogenase (ubiquinone) Fe-S protein 8